MIRRHRHPSSRDLRVDELLAARLEANARFFEARGRSRWPRCCHRMAERFARGGRLVAFGRSPAARSDARHIAVEFVHPVIVGKRALPALGLAAEGGPLAAQAAAVVERDDIAVAFEADAGPARRSAALQLARERGCADDRLRRRGRRVGVRAAAERPVRAPGAGRDALPRALGAGARVLRPPRAARRARGARGPRQRRLELPLSVPLRVRGRPRRRARRRPPVGADQGRPRSPSCASRRWARTARR